MNLCVLISCMHQEDTSIVQHSNIQTDVVVINQCDKNSIEETTFINRKGKECHIKFISTTERGLSRSRNIAMEYSLGDICLFCDDDELFEDNYEETILQSFNQYPDEDILVFNVKNPKQKVYPTKTYSIGIFRAAKVHSWQIAFRKDKIPSSVRFCEKMGSGTGNGAGEENKFIIDCRKKGLKIRCIPINIGTVAQTTSQWFKGYTEEYWKNRGWVAKMIYGHGLGLVYIFYCIFWRNSHVDEKHSAISMALWMLKGYSLKR